MLIWFDVNLIGEFKVGGVGGDTGLISLFGILSAAVSSVDASCHFSNLSFHVLIKFSLSSETSWSIVLRPSNIVLQ